ncbi:MAG TPA: hypothetical protein V6C69_03935 [Trichormus sp.]|jgi:hypothetical protein
MSNSGHSDSTTGNHRARSQELDELWDRIEVVRGKLKGEIAYLKSNRQVALTRAYQIFGVLCAVVTIINCLKELSALLRGEKRKKDSMGAIVFNTSLVVGKFVAEEVYRRYNESQSDAPQLVCMSADESDN